MLQCYNRGCGQTYDPANNNDEACRHHPGEPYFHDAYKGWSCCKKKSVDFTEFLSIKGCTVSKHSNVKPPEPVKIINNEEIEKEPAPMPAPIKEAMQRPPINTAMVTIKSTVAPTLKQSIDELSTKTSVAADINKLAPGEIAVGTACKNSGCTYSYTGTSKDDYTCTHHPGVPIFHEGMKYWSCCQRKTSDFTNFMAQRGCVDGEHKWIKENENKKSVQCRYDWHQTASDVIVSIYAKMYHYAESILAVNPIRLNVSLVFPAQDSAKFELDLELRGIIDAKRSTAHMYGSKLEITLPKAEPGLWSKLNFAQVPPAKGKVTKVSKPRRSSGSDDDFDLDDIETVNTGMRLAEIRPEDTEHDMN